MNKVLVLLGLYDGKEWIEEQVESILSQSGVELSLVIGDDVSKDGGADILERQFGGRGLEVFRFSSNSGGAGQNFFRLLKLIDPSRYDYVAFSDQDDVWLPGKMERALEGLQGDRVVGYSASVKAFWPSGKTLILSQKQKMTDLDFLFEGAGQGCTFVIKRDFALRVKNFLNDSSSSLKSLHYHDWTIYALSRAWGYAWFFDERPALLYRQHEGNDTGARGAISGVKKRLNLIRSGWYRKQVVAIFHVVSSVGEGAIPKDFRATFLSESGVVRRLSLARILFLRGRRRFSDRVILMISSILGWI